MTRFLADILRQPAELRACIARLGTSGAVREAARLVAGASDLYVVGIGASYHACLAVASHLGPEARAAEASQLLHQESFRPGSVLLVLSRSGKSVEVVGVLEQARRHGARVVAVTNDPASPLGAGADVVLPLGVTSDHAVSVVTYTALGLAAAAATGRPLAALERSLGALEDAIPGWRGQLEEWTPPEGAAYFLGRGAGFGTAQEARLLWEEAAKSPATALSTGAFRHGPQEIVRPGLLVGLVIDGKRRREEDLQLARDLGGLGAEVFLVGRGLGAGRGVFRLPEVDPGWQFMLEVVPFQLAAERAARVRGVDCDAFRLCSYVVEFEGGLLRAGL